jgi:hypothetical protein
MTSKSDGSTADYYELPAGATQLQHLISYRNLNSQDGEMFRAIYRKGRASHSDELRDARKVLFYAQAEVERLEKYANKCADPFPDTVLDLAATWDAGEARISNIASSHGDGEHYANIWHHWTGGECPCDELSMVEVVIRDGDQGRGRAGLWLWSHCNNGADIIRYRML